MFVNIINTIAYFLLDIFRYVEYLIFDVTNMLHIEPNIPNEYEDWYTEFQNEMLLLFEKRPHTHVIVKDDDEDKDDLDSIKNEDYNLYSDSDLDYIANEELDYDWNDEFTEEDDEEIEEEYTKIRLVSIEGNIGAGKSTLIQTLQEKYKDRSDILFIQEPIDIWNTIQDNKGKNILQYFYENLGKYAFAFQIMAYTTRLNLIKETIQNASKKVKVIVMERSLEADSNIFAKMLFEEGVMNTIEYQIYNLMGKDNWNDYGVDGIIWLRTEPEECYSRIQHRNREGEQDINLEYLRKCHQYHLEWLSADMGFVCDIGNSSDPKGLELDLEKIDNYLF